MLYYSIMECKEWTGMTITKINYFLDLAKTLNYTETAEHFYTTQSNISKQIMALEKELDVILFIREHRTITLSPAGEAFVPLAQNMLENYQSILNAMIPFRLSSHKTLHICTLPVMSHYDVPALLSQFHQAHKDIFLDIKEMESVHLLSSLDEGTCEIACARLFHDLSSKYDQIVFDYDELSVILPNDHPLAQNTMITLDELKNENFYQLDEHTNQYQLFRNACTHAGFEPNVAYTGTRLNNILSFIASGMGISILMKHSVEVLHYPGICIVPLDHPVKSKLAFIRIKKEKHSEPNDLFWRFLKTKFKS